eukprot:scaffold276_cov132-Cylindrotheca_fusiformis.AAC.3
MDVNEKDSRILWGQGCLMLANQNAYIDAPPTTASTKSTYSQEPSFKTQQQQRNPAYQTLYAKEHSAALIPKTKHHAIL